MTCSSDPLDDSCVGMECKCSALNEARTCTMFSVRNSTRQRPPVFEQFQARTSQWDGSLAQSAWQLTLLVETMWVVMSFHGEDSFSLTAQDQITRQGFRTETANVMNRGAVFPPTSGRQAAEANGKKTDLVDSIPRCYQSNTIFRVDSESAIQSARPSQAGVISRGHAEAHAQIRSSRALGDEQPCETTREILAKAKADFKQGNAGLQKALSILKEHNRRRWEECRLEGRGQRLAPGDCRDAF